MSATLADYWAERLEWPTPPKPADVQGPVPDYTAEEMAEVIRLISPLRILRDGRWVQIPCDLATLRATQHEYITHLHEVASAAFKESGPYKLAVVAIERQRQEEAEDRREQRDREQHLATARDNRISKLVQHGVSPREAEKLVAEHESKAHA